MHVIGRTQRSQSADLRHRLQKQQQQQKNGAEFKALAKQTRKSTQVNAKFAKPELAYGLAMGGNTDSQVGSQAHASRKKW